MEDATASDFFIRRARLTFDASINDLIDGRVQPDFGGGSLSLKDAYFRLKFSPAFRVSVGQFKRAFDIFELTSSTEIIPVERTGGIPGLGRCAGVGGVCSLSRFTERLSYSDRDTGIRIDGSSSDGRVAYLATVTNGTGTDTKDENDAKSFAGRITLSAAENVSLAANVSVHDYPSDLSEDDEYAVAWGGDVAVGSFYGGPMIRAGLIGGDNWRRLDDVSGEEASFLTAQGILSYYHAVQDRANVAGVEPLLRLSWGDPDGEEDDDGGILVTPGLNVYFAGRNRIQVNLDWYSPQGDADAEFSLKVQTALYF